MALALVDPCPTPPTDRQQSVDETESKQVGAQRQANAHESRLVKETEFALVADERRYPL